MGNRLSTVYTGIHYAYDNYLPTIPRPNGWEQLKVVLKITILSIIWMKAFPHIQVYFYAWNHNPHYWYWVEANRLRERASRGDIGAHEEIMLYRLSEDADLEYLEDEDFEQTFENEDRLLFDLDE
jgi:hypothetical protein